MNQTELGEIIRLHGLWLRGDLAGQRADLCEADLREADLGGADLGGADLREANLRRANLRWANLRWANLSGADLSGADLSGANLRWARGIVCLPVGDPTYRPVAVDHGDEWVIASGCRWFTVDEAREHWGADDYERGPLLGQQYVAAVDWLQANSDAIRRQWV